MHPPKLIEIADTPLADIDRSQRLRPISAAAVESLKASLQEIGQKDEIHVRRIKKSGKLKLLAGGHRMAAFEQLGRETIRAKIWDCTDDQALIIEIDDNLAHADLSPLDLAVFLARRKEAYERMYPQAKAATGAALVAKRWDTAELSSVVSFVTSAAERIGITERQVRKIVAAGAALGAAEIHDLRRAKRPVTLADLQVIAKCADAPERYDVCRALADGKATTAAKVLRSLRAEPGAAAKDPAEEGLQRLLDAWARASTAARRKFVKRENVALFNLLHELDGGLSE